MKQIRSVDRIRRSNVCSVASRMLCSNRHLRLPGRVMVLLAGFATALTQLQVVAAAQHVSQPIYIKPDNSDARDQFGWATDVSGNRIVISALTERSAGIGPGGLPDDNSAVDAGAVYVFVLGTNGWEQEAYLKASNTEARDQFGWDVAIDGDTIVVSSCAAGFSEAGDDSSATTVNGDQFDNSAPGAGAAYVFVRSGSTWSQQAYLKATNTDSLDHFGRSVDVSGDLIVVGAPAEASSARVVDGDALDNSAPRAGAAYVYVRSGTLWDPQAYLKASNADAGDEFGGSVGIQGSTIVVGAHSESSLAFGTNSDGSDNSAQRAGAAYVFEQVGGTTWVQRAILKASNTDPRDSFGTSVVIHGDTIAVGSSGEDSIPPSQGGSPLDDSLTDSGAVYTFERSGTDWVQSDFLKASNAGAFDGFGSLSINGDVLAVGAGGECGFGTGTNSTQFSLSPCFGPTGSAYLFRRHGQGWIQTDYLKSSNPDANDRFGIALAVTQETLIIGARTEDGGSAAVGGNLLDNGSVNAGAAYVFDINAGTPAQTVFTSLCRGNGPQADQCTDCPCGNRAPIHSRGGCLNSLGRTTQLMAHGATALSAGSTSDLRFSVTECVPRTHSILLSSSELAPADVQAPCFGTTQGITNDTADGLICAATGLVAHGGRKSDGLGRIGVSNRGWGGVDPPAPSIGLHAGFVPGQTRIFQAFYRDYSFGACTAGVNTSQAVVVTFIP